MKNYEMSAIIGIALILLISLLFGFREMLIEAANHIINDLTVGLAVHAYIAGLILAAYAAYLYAKRSKRKKRKR